MRTLKLAPFGLEVRDLDIAALSQAAADALPGLIAANRVVVFRNQSGGDAALVKFLKQLGPLTFTVGETPVAGAPDLNLVSNLGRTTPPRSVFHTDTSYVASPPAFTALREVVLPAHGGQTVFSDQVAAFLALPLALRSRLANCTLQHRTTGLDGRSESQNQPLFRRHPITGETALYLSTPERCSDLSGLEPTTSARLVSVLYRRSIRASNLYRHTWHKGDVVIWDNRLTMHRADHCAVQGDRVLHRGMVIGEQPIHARVLPEPNYSTLRSS